MRRIWLTLLLAAATPILSHAADSKKKESKKALDDLEPTLVTPEPAKGVVPHEKLLPFLPPIPKGWAAEKPDGSVVNSDDINLSTVSRIYYAKDNTSDDAPSATVTIIDSATNHDFFDRPGEEWEKTEKTEDSYDKRLKIDGMRAVEHYDKTTRTASLSIFVAKRYYVQIELNNLKPEDLYTWFKSMNISGLAALK